MNNSVIKFSLIIGLVSSMAFNQVSARQSHISYGRIERINHKTGKVKLVDLQEEIERLERKLERKGIDVTALRDQFDKEHQKESSLEEQEYTWVQILYHLGRATKELVSGSRVLIWLTGKFIVTTIVPMIKNALSDDQDAVSSDADENEEALVD